MNELYNNDSKRKNSSRRWIYVTCAMIILCVLMLMPQPQTVRLALLVAPDHQPEMIIAIPKGCRLENVYLRGNEHVPRDGKLFMLEINKHKFVMSDFGKQAIVKASTEPGYENRAAVIDWNLMKGDTTLTVVCSDVHKDIQRNDLELVCEVTGDPDVVKKWDKFVKLRLPGQKISK